MQTAPGDETHRLHAIGRIKPNAVRYIKLGRGGEHASSLICEGAIGIDFVNISHDLCLKGEWDAVRDRFLALGKDAARATDHTREIRNFYERDSDTLWITFSEGRLWWAFADTTVTFDPAAAMPRQRRVLGAWRDTSICGEPLRTQSLSTRLTKTARYKGTICEVEEQDYLLRRIKGLPEPLVAEALEIRSAAIKSAASLIERLHEKDFEILADLILGASGWRRVSVLGETERDIDLLVEQIATGERGFVQVKSTASPATLHDYVSRFRAYPNVQRMFFVCHSPSAKLQTTPPAPGVELWFGDALAAKALQAGLFDWLIERVS